MLVHQCKRKLCFIPDVPSIYAIPVMMNKQGLDQQIVEKLKIKCSKAKLNDWKKVIRLESEQKGKQKLQWSGSTLTGRFIQIRQ